MRFRYISAALALTFMAGMTASAQNSPSAEGARVYVINLENGQHVQSPVLIQFGLSGMGVAPFGNDGPNTDNTGHHHLIIDADPPTAGAIPADAQHIHYGRGQTEASVELTPGEHTLYLVFGDMSHQLHNPPVISEPVTIIVDP